VIVDEGVGGGIVLEAAKVHGEFASGLVTKCGIFFQAFGDDVLECKGKLRIELARRKRRAVQDCVEQAVARKFGERALAGSHFVEDEAGGVEIGTSVEFTAEKLLRGHVRERASERVSFELGLRDRFGKRRAKAG